jgi:hypothetical protein
MSGMELLVGGSLLVSAAGAGFNMYSQNEAYKIREKSLRNQQTALRLQETEAELENMDNLEKVLARQEVMSGVRNIRADSGSLAALTNETFNEFDRTNDINHLNFTAKKAQLANASLANSLERRNGMVKAGLSFASDAISTGTKYKSLLDYQTIAARSGGVSPQGAL